ncbi:MerR family DNA-binding transcriptional regulator [Streptomyces canus]|uniref:MerR family DNA-binding transcriptional regulator n=1 Tax=Streptomyces canus TaxID=58343 RepID=UPI0033BC8FB3
MTLTVAAAERLIRIGEVARGAGVSVPAVRYCERQGLLIAPPARPRQAFDP